MKRRIPLLAVLLATQTGCSILSGNTTSVPIASNNGNNNGSYNGSYNGANTALPEQVPIGVTRLASADPSIPTGAATPATMLPANISLNRVSTELANLPRTQSGALDLQSIYYGGDVNPAISMDRATPTQTTRTAAAAPEAVTPTYDGASGSR